MVDRSEHPPEGKGETSTDDMGVLAGRRSRVGSRPADYESLWVCENARLLSNSEGVSYRMRQIAAAGRNPDATKVSLSGNSTQATSQLE